MSTVVDIYHVDLEIYYVDLQKQFSRRKERCSRVSRDTLGHDTMYTTKAVNVMGGVGLMLLFTNVSMTQLGDLFSDEFLENMIVCPL